MGIWTYRGYNMRFGFATLHARNSVLERGFVWVIERARERRESRPLAVETPTKDPRVIQYTSIDVNLRAHDGSPALLLICQSSSRFPAVVEAATALLDAGADPNLGSLDEMPPLIAAIKVRNSLLVELLLARGADPKITWYNGWTALHEAAAVGDDATVATLIAMNVDLFAIDEDHLTALYVACQEGRTLCVQLMLKAAGERAAELANMTSTDGGSCVYVAAQDGYDKCVELLVAIGADVNLTVSPVWAGPNDCQDGGVHVVATASQKNFHRCLRLIMPHVDLDILARSELDPLAVAAAAGSSESIEILLEGGLPVDRRTFAPTNLLIISFLRPIFQRPYYSALREAVRKGQEEPALLLMDAGAPLTYASDCYSPFLFTFRNRIPVGILRAFLERNVDLNLICQGSRCQVPDALLAVLGSENRHQLVTLLKCGLKPKLQYWCSCRNTGGYSLLHEVKNLDYVGECSDLMAVLVEFWSSSCYIPRCCTEMSEVLSGKFKHLDGIRSLQELCRLRIRENVRPSELLDDRWMESIDYLPPKLRQFLCYHTYVGVL
uniref:SOCS box domain-containing protein n=1 Tax=Plectus sambesii TaxID=2011161 RepID=A0A914XDM0_9BILA